MLHEDNTTVGKTFAHPKAALAETPAPRPAASVAGRMFLAVVCGVFFGLLLSVIIAPGFAFAFAVAGAMSFGAGAVALILMKPGADDSRSAGTARTDAEVRDALAEIKAGDK